MATPGTQGTPAAAPGAGWAAVQKASVVVGVVFLLVGALGFVPGVTTDYDTLALAGHHSDARLFGVFEVSALHNAVHVLFGVLGLLLWRTFNGARIFLLAGGAVYALLAFYGVLVDHDGPANVVPVNVADNWLHLALAVGMLTLGLLLGRTKNVPHDVRHV
jgi:4-hydroxybenzoate polyprenyltransferase